MKLGEIEGVEIYSEEYSGWAWEGNAVWFVQECVRNVPLITLKKLKYKVAKYLVKTGFSIRVPYLFDAKLKRLLEVSEWV